MTVVQVLWLLTLLLPESVFGVAVVLLMLAELSVPLIAESTESTPWHPHHITER